MRSPRERGAALIVVMIIVAALLAGAAVVTSIALSSTRSTDVAKSETLARYCAEAGLAAAIPVVAANPALWAGNLCTTRPYSTCAQPGFLGDAAFSHDLDGDGVDDFVIAIADNDDELSPIPNNLAVDLDHELFVVSRCVKYPDSAYEATVLESFATPIPTRELYLRTQ